MMIRHTFLDAYLVGHGLITESQLLQARAHQQKSQISLPVALLQLGWIDLTIFEDLLDLRDSPR